MIEEQMQILANIDDILTATLFATLAGLSIATASLAHLIRVELESFVRREFGDRQWRKLKGIASDGSAKNDDDFCIAKTQYESLSKAVCKFTWAFYAFVVSLALVFGFDAFVAERLLVQTCDIVFTGAPFASGVVLLVLGAHNLILSGSLGRS